MIRVRPLLAVALGVALLGTACGSSSGDKSASGGSSTTTAAAKSEVCTADRKGGTITMGTRTLANSLDPTVVTGTGAVGATENDAVYDTLMRWDPDAQKVVPQLAKSVTSNADHTVWTLTLRPGVKFGNGDALTAEAVRFNMDRMSKGTTQAGIQAKLITSMRVIDDLNIEFTLKQPWGSFDYFLATEAGMITNPTVVNAMGAKFGSNPVGAGVGPYEVVKFQPGVEIDLKAKDNYWGGPVCVTNLKFIHVNGDRATYEAFQKGEMDVAFLEGGDVLHDLHAANVKGFSTLAAGAVTLVFNIARGPNPVMADVRLRKAVAEAIDPKLVTDRIFGGYGRPNTGITDPKQTIYTGVDGIKYNPSDAKALVSAAKASGFDGKVTLTCQNTPTGTEESTTLKGLLDAAGFNTTVESLPQPELTQKFVVRGDFQIVCGALGIPEGSGAIRSLSAYRSDSPYNRAGYKSPAMDAAVDQLYAATDVKSTKAALKAIGEDWNKGLPGVNLWTEDWFVAYSSKVHGLVRNRDGVVTFDKAYVQQ